MNVINTVFSVNQIRQNLLSLPVEKTVVFLDIDNTIIAPKSLTFRHPPYSLLIDTIKESKHLYPNFEQIISNWRLRRKIMLLDRSWPQFIKKLKSIYQVYGLTKVNTGKFGNIESMENWRHNELILHNICFTRNTNIISQDGGSSFFNGIMMTGYNSKSATLSEFIDHINPLNYIVFVDDNNGNLEEMSSFCNKNKIDFLGLHYKGLDKIKGKQDYRIFNLQKTMLLEQAKWIEDGEAQQILDNSKQLRS